MTTLLRRLAAAVHGIFHRDRLERELDEELQEYLDHLVAAKIAAGLAPEDARRLARAELGSVAAAKDAVRDVGWETALETWWTDVRYAVRVLRASPVFTAITIVTLALGIGANSAIFTVVNGLLLRPLPVAEPQQLVVLASNRAVSDGVPAGWTYPVWRQIQQHAGAFAGAAAWSGGGGPVLLNLAPRGPADRVPGMVVSGEFFTTLGVTPLLGRTFTPADDAAPGRDGPAAVISYGMWQRRFGGTADVIGRALTIERVPFTIVGVLPPQFLGADIGHAFDVAIPLGAEPLVHQGRGSWIDDSGPSFLAIVLRLRPGQTMAAATALLVGLQPAIFDAAQPGAGLARPGQSPPEAAELRRAFLADPFALVPLGETSEVRQTYQRPLIALLVIVSAVLLIACANIANLLLSRAAARRRELDVRAALGATRWRLARQLLVESALLAATGVAAGLVLASWGSRALVTQLSRFSLVPVALDLSLDWRVVLFTVAVGTITLLLFGLVPAVRAARADAPTRKPGPAAPRIAMRGGPTGRSTLVAAQVALSLVLLVTAGLFVRTFERLASRPTGFDVDRVLIAVVDTSRAAEAGRTDLHARLMAAAAGVPGVASAAGSPTTPVSGSAIATMVELPGGPRVRPDEPPFPLYLITPEWLATYGSTIVAGRGVTPRDVATSEPIVLVNESFARRFFPDGHVLGRQVRDAWAPPGQTPQTRTIVGVVRDSIFSSLWDVIPPLLYQPLTQAPPFISGIGEISIGIRVQGAAPMAVAGGVASALAAVDPEISFSFRTLEERVAASIAHERLVALLSGFFSVLALVLAATGLYGLTAYGAAQRRSEIGIRMALGALRGDVIALVLRRTLAITAGGIAVGLGAAAAATRYLEAMLYEISPLDPATFGAVAVLFAMVAVVAAFLPARRAATADPLQALRAE